LHSWVTLGTCTNGFLICQDSGKRLSLVLDLSTFFNAASLFLVLTDAAAATLYILVLFSLMAVVLADAGATAGFAVVPLDLVLA